MKLKHTKKAMKRRRMIFYTVLTVILVLGLLLCCGLSEKGVAEEVASADNEINGEIIIQSRYTEVHISDTELREMAAMIYLEARGESFEGQQAVAEVILNRVASPQFPNTVHDVLYQKRQFSPIKRINKVKPTETQYKAISAALYGEPILPMDVVFFARRAENKNVWGKIGNHTFCYAYKW